MTDSKPPSDSEERQDEKWYDRTRYQILLFSGGTALFGLVLGLILDWYIDPQTSTQKKDLVQALGLITAGVAGAVGIFFTWRGQERNQRNTQEQFRLTRQSQEQNQKSTQAQLENAQEELRLTRQGQITERFTRAIDQLGSEKLEIRLGGIYALERIDKESPEREYHGTVMEVLTAYVRENSRWEPEESSTSTTASNEEAERDTSRPWLGVEQDAEPTLQRLPTDIIAILDVLRRREEEHVPVEHRVILDLREANLEEANFKEANLEEANFRGAYLRVADFEYASLQGAYLEGADLQFADFECANLQHAALHAANLKVASFRGSNLQEANLFLAALQYAKLQQANLKNARLQQANLQYANLQGADLQGADLQGAIFEGAGLEEVDLQGADLQEANLQGAYLQEAYLQEANLQETNLQEANLRGAEVTDEQLADTRSLQGATMPDGQKYEDWLRSPPP